jgi:protein ImuB
MKRIACIHLTGDAADSSALDDRREAIAECCGRCTPIVGFEPTDRQSMLLDITGLAHLFGGEAAMIEAVVGDLTQLGFAVRTAVADTIGAAWAAVHYCVLPTDKPICHFESSIFLHSLPIESLRLSPDTLRLLHDLGLTRVGQLEAIPREEFLSRFGPGLLRRMDQAFGRLDEPLPACSLSPKFAVRWSVEYPTARRETIAAGIERMIARVAAMLARCNRGALRLDCRLELESDGQTPNVRGLPLSVGLFQPTADAKRLFELVELQLERLRIGSPVMAVHVAASLTSSLKPRKQATLFELDDDSRQPRLLASLIERLASRLGTKAVVGVRLRPEAQPEFSWHYDPLVGVRRRRNVVKQLPAELPPRPLRLLSRPAALAVTSIAPDGPLLRFHFNGEEHAVTRSWGPERIETGWWRGHPIGRDYFRIETVAANRYWLFRRLRDGKWFLHGTFE